MGYGYFQRARTVEMIFDNSRRPHDSAVNPGDQTDKEKKRDNIKKNNK